MSLINEALKKAQRQRHDDAAGSLGQPGANGPVTKRAQPKSATSMLLLVAGGLVLVAVSIIATTMWLTRPATPTVTTPKPIATATPTSPSTEASAPVVVVPVIAPAKPSAPDVKAEPKPMIEPRTNPVASTSSPAVSLFPPPASDNSKPAVSVTVTPAPKPDVPAVTAKPDERISKFVEALRVTGIRSSGTESKVLMNDRVYRVNDIVDRALGVRLTKVSADSLTFTDDNGATYVKYF